MGVLGRMWFIPQSAERHSDTCGLRTGNLHVRCEPRLCSAGVENFHHYYAIPVSEKIKCIQLTKCQCHLPPYPSGSYDAGGETGAPLLVQPANKCCGRATLW